MNRISTTLFTPSLFTLFILLLLGGCGSVNFSFHEPYEHPLEPTMEYDFYEGLYSSENENKLMFRSGDFSPLIKKLSQKCQDNCKKLGRHEFYALCAAYFAIRDYDNFFKFSQQYLDKYSPYLTQKKSAGLYETAYCIALYTQRGALFLDTGANSKARKEIETAIKLYEDNAASLQVFYHYWMVDMPFDVYVTAGNFYARQGEYSQVEEMIARIDAMRDPQFAGIKFIADAFDVDIMIRPHKNLSRAKLLMTLGRYEDVYATLISKEDWLNQSGGEMFLKAPVDQPYRVTQKESLLKQQPTFYLPRRFLLAKSLYRLGRFEEAHKAYFSVLDAPNISSFGAFYYVTMHDLALLDARKGKHSLAIKRLKVAIKTIESQRASISTESSKIGFVGDKQQVYNDLVQALIDNGRVSEAFSYAERGKARALVDILSQKRSFGSGATAQESQKLLAKLARIEGEQASSRYPSSVSQSSHKVRSTRQTGIEDIESLSKELASLVTVKALSATDIQARLANDETLVEFYGAGDSLIAFVLTRNTIKAIPLQNSNLADKVRKFRADILQYNSNNYLHSSKDLYEQLITPLLPHLTTSQLTIVPHGPLHYLPFNALHDGRSFMVSNYAIRLLPSASVLEFLQKPKQSSGKMLILCNPDLNNPEYDLPGAENEGLALKKAHADSILLKRKAATETALKKYGSSVAILHIASHGQFVSADPLQSRLLLAGDSSNDGNLTVSDLYDLQLNNDLVTLSACETGMGEVNNGDDVIGLSRGFLFAGANSIVTSLWVVDDTATKKLMVQFYAGLSANSKLEALTLAQRQIMNQYNQHPFFWAAFQLTGGMK